MPYRQGREIRVMVKPEEVNDDQMILTAREIVKKIEIKPGVSGTNKNQSYTEKVALLTTLNNFLALKQL